MARKTLDDVYLEKYGKTWGLSDIEKCTFEYREVITNDLVKLLSTLTTNRDWIFAGNNHLNKLNQIVYAIRNELYMRENESETPTPKPQVRSFVRREDHHSYHPPSHNQYPRRDTEINYNK